MYKRLFRGLVNRACLLRLAADCVVGKPSRMQRCLPGTIAELHRDELTEVNVLLFLLGNVEAGQHVR